MNSKDPVFTSTKEASHSSFGKDQRLGKPRHVFLWEVYHGNEAALQQGIDSGAVEVWTVGDQEMCSYRALKSGIKKQVSDKHKLSGGENKLKKDSFAEVAAALDSLSFDFDDSGSQPLSLGEGGSTSSAMAPKKCLNLGS